MPHATVETDADNLHLAVISCQRNEGLWLCEWVAYQRAIGFGRVFVISNDCTDGSDLILDRLEELGEVVHIRQTVPDGVPPQPAGCALALSHQMMATVEWALHCDIDEFLNVSTGQGQVADLLGVVGEADCIAVNWRMFGSNGRRVWDRGDVLTRNVHTQGWLRRGWVLQKCLFRPDRFGAVVCHMPKEPKTEDVVLKNTAGVRISAQSLYEPDAARQAFDSAAMITWQNAVLNHYAIKSEDHFLLKNVRGDGMAMVHSKYLKNSLFWQNADANSVEDRTILRHWPGVAERLARYRRDPVIAELEDAAWNAFVALREEVLFTRGDFGWDRKDTSVGAALNAEELKVSDDPDKAGDGDKTDVPRPRPRRARLPDTAVATRHLLDNLPLGRATVVVDVGANPLDDPPYRALLDMHGCNVIGFEPQADAFERLQTSKSPHETYFPFAVGDGSKKELRIFRNSGMTSVFDPYLPTMRLLGRTRMGQVRDRHEMQTVALDEVPEIGRFDLLKIDIQGGEVDVFRGCDRKLRTAMAVIVELRHLRLYEGEPMASGVDLELRNRGFILHKFLFNKSLPIQNSQSDRLVKSENRDQLLDGDAVYIRDVTRMSDIDDDGLSHLAVLASSVFGSHSLAIACLDALAGRGRIGPDLAAQYVDRLPKRLLRET